MKKLLDTRKRHRRTTPIPVSPAPDMAKLLQTGPALGRKRQRIASGMSEPSVPASAVIGRMAMDVDPPPAVHFADPSHARPGRSPSIEVIAGPYPVPHRRPNHPSSSHPVDPPTSPMNFSSASEDSASSSGESDTIARPPSSPPPARNVNNSTGKKRKRSTPPPAAGPSSARTHGTQHGGREAIPPVVAAPPNVPLPEMSKAATRPRSDKGKRKAVEQDVIPRDRWPTPPPLSLLPEDNLNAGHPVGSRPSGSRRRDNGTGDNPSTGMNPAAWHPYTGGGPGLVRSMDRFEQMMKVTRDYEKQFLAKVRVFHFLLLLSRSLS